MGTLSVDTANGQVSKIKQFVEPEQNDSWTEEDWILPVFIGGNQI